MHVSPGSLVADVGGQTWEIRLEFRIRLGSLTFPLSFEKFHESPQALDDFARCICTIA